MVDNERLYEALTRFASTMSAGYDLSEVLYRLSDDVTEVLGVTGAGIAVVDEGGALRYATASSDIVTELERVQEEFQQGPCMEAYLTQQPVTVADIATRADWPAYHKEAQRLGFTSVAGIPLSLGAERFGALNIYNLRPHEWGERDLGLARVLADMAAGYMVHSTLVKSRLLAEQLQYALDSRVLIEQAKGVLSAASGISIDEAFAVLRHHSRSNSTSLRVVAKAVVEDGFRPEAD